jgi:hypothetical protein
MDGYERWEQERRALAGAEAEMAVAAAEAVVRLRVAEAWLRSADADLGALRRVTWGGVVDQWHDAVEAVADSAETLRAYEVFGG